MLQEFLPLLVISVLQTHVLDAHLDGRSLLQAVEKDGRPLSSLWRISQILRDPSSCRSETSSQERAAFGGRSPPQSERARAVGKSTRAEIPTHGLLGGKDLLCMVCRPLFLLRPSGLIDVFFATSKPHRTKFQMRPTSISLKSPGREESIGGVFAVLPLYTFFGPPASAL